MTRWGHGKYGMPGGEAIAARFDQMTKGSFFASSVDDERGFLARLNYLVDTDRGSRALADAGVRLNQAKLTDWLIGDWKGGGVKPTADSRRRVDTAYRRVRSHNLANWLKGQLTAKDARGRERGRRVDVQPLSGSSLPAHQRTRQQQFADRRIAVSIRHWRALVDAWAKGDLDAMDDLWMDICDDALGYEASGYYEVAHIGF